LPLQEEKMGLHDFTFYNVIRQNSLSFGSKPAWLEVEDGRCFSYRDCRGMVEKVSAGLKRYGLKKGDRVGILAKNSFEYFLLMGGAAALGAIALPVNWRLSEEEVRFILKDGEPALLFTDHEFSNLVQGLKGALPSVKGYFSLPGGSGEFTPFDALLAEGGAFQPEEVGSEDGLVIIHTAAVAGRPRGALLSHSNVLCADMHFIHQLKITDRDVHLCFLPLFHVGGLFMTTSCFHAGALNLNMKRFDAAQATKLIQEKRVSFMMVFSPILSTILDEGEKGDFDLSSLRAVTGIDTAATIERYQNRTGGVFYVLYGQTETSCLATLGPYGDKPGSAGRVLPLAEVRLVDDYDHPVDQGKVGEITVKGPMVFKGYWGLPEETSYTFREGWHHTGDLGRFDEDGFLWYAGRKAEKELIKPGGENVYPAEVEKVILQHPAVEKTIVFGVPDPKWKEGIKAVCQLKPGKSLEPRELIDFVGERIARYKKPAHVEFVKELPLLENGSIDRNKVKALYGGG
jgi:long-chain acyl-CoA synthetase